MVSLSLPPLAVAVRETSYVPEAEYMWVGFCKLEVVPSPKFQFQEMAFPALLSVKLIEEPTQVELVSTTKSAIIALINMLVTIIESQPLMVVKFSTNWVGEV